MRRPDALVLVSGRVVLAEKFRFADRKRDVQRFYEAAAVDRSGRRTVRQNGGMREMNERKR